MQIYSSSVDRSTTFTPSIFKWGKRTHPKKKTRNVALSSPPHLPAKFTYQRRWNRNVKSRRWGRNWCVQLLRLTAADADGFNAVKVGSPTSPPQLKQNKRERGGGPSEAASTVTPIHEWCSPTCQRPSNVHERWTPTAAFSFTFLSTFIHFPQLNFQSNRQCKIWTLLSKLRATRQLTF